MLLNDVTRSMNKTAFIIRQLTTIICLTRVRTFIDAQQPIISTFLRFVQSPIAITLANCVSWWNFSLTRFVKLKTTLTKSDWNYNWLCYDLSLLSEPLFCCKIRSLSSCDEDCGFEADNLVCNVTAWLMKTMRWVDFLFAAPAAIRQ